MIALRKAVRDATPKGMSIPFAPQSMEFGLGENADAIRDTTARWAADRLAPLAAEIDEERGTDCGLASAIRLYVLRHLQAHQTGD